MRREHARRVAMSRQTPVAKAAVAVVVAGFLAAAVRMVTIRSWPALPDLPHRLTGTRTTRCAHRAIFCRINQPASAVEGSALDTLARRHLVLPPSTTNSCPVVSESSACQADDGVGNIVRSGTARQPMQRQHQRFFLLSAALPTVLTIFATQEASTRLLSRAAVRRPGQYSGLRSQNCCSVPRRTWPFLLRWAHNPDRNPDRDSRN